MNIDFKFWKNKQPVVQPAQPVQEPTLDHRSFNLESPWQINVKYDLSKPFINEYAGTRWIPFGVDNLYPYVLLDFYNNSPFHAAIIDFKARAVLGEGLEITTKGISNLEREILKGKLRDRLSKRFMRRFVLEWLIHERIYLEFSRRGDKGTFFNIIPAERVRVSQDDQKGFWVNPDWRRKRGNAEFVHAYDKYNTESKMQMLEFTSDTPGFDFYAVPGYAAAANWIYLDGEIAFLQKQNLQNTINPSAIFKFPQDIKNKEEKEFFIRNLQDSFTGAKNAGKVMVFFANGKDLLPEVQMADPNKLDTAFAGVQENIVKNVSYSHLLNPSLMGIATPGQLGANQQLEDAYYIFNEIWLSPTQDILEEFLNEALKVGGYDATVKIIRKEKFLPERPESETITLKKD